MTFYLSAALHFSMRKGELQIEAYQKSSLIKQTQKLIKNYKKP